MASKEARPIKDPSLLGSLLPIITLIGCKVRCLEPEQAAALPEPQVDAPSAPLNK